MNTKALMEQLEKQRHRVDFDTYDITVQQLIAMVESGSIDVAPAYQRQFRWDANKRAHLIESVFLGVPVPSLFMATNRDGTWELVDGVQRLSTLVQFAGTPQARHRLGLQDALKIEGLEKLSELNNASFSSLPDSLKLQFNLRPIKVITLSDKSDLGVRFDLFERLNTGGVALTNQEIRACIYRGPVNEFFEHMAATPEFHKVVLLTKRQDADGTRAECVLRFFAFYYRYKRFDHSVVDFLNQFMKDASISFDFSANEKLFLKTFQELAKVLPHGIVRKSSRSVTPINLYEAVAVGAALALGVNTHLVESKIDDWLSSEDLRKLTTGATNNRSTVIGRIEYCRDQFLGV